MDKESLDKVSSYITDINKIKRSISNKLCSNLLHKDKEINKDDYLNLLAQVSEIHNKVSTIFFSIQNSDIPVIEHADVSGQEFFQDSFGTKVGDLVKIKPCGEWAENKTFLGFFIGDVPTSTGIKREDDKLKCFLTFNNPAIFIPEVKRIVFGMESWWSKINNIEELKEITDEDINNTWYVQLLKEMNE